MSHQIQNTAVNVINSLREELVELVDKDEVELLTEKADNYTQLITKYYLSNTIDKDKLTRENIQNLKELISHHRNLISVLSDKKKKIKADLRQLRIGNEMKQTYPNNI